MTTQAEFLQEYAPDGVMTPQLAAQLLELGLGDTASAETGAVPAAAPAVEQAADDKPAEPEAKPVLMAKDGVHTIDYQKLVDAREGERAATARAEALANELQALKAQAQARADAGQAPTQADNVAAAAEAAIEQGVNPEIFGDFSEEALANGIKTLMGREVAKLSSELRGELAQLAKPLQEQLQVNELEAHQQAIQAAHPDIGSIAESQELAKWIAGQPSFARPGYEAAYNNGSAAQVIELLDAFKASTGRTTQTPAPVDAKLAAKAAIAKLPASVPTSLSDIPGGTAGPVSKHESMSKLSGIALAEAMMGMTDDAKRDFLNRQL